MAMLIGLQQCLQHGMYSIIVESDSKLVTGSVTEEITPPWRILQIVEEIKKIVDEREVTVQHCFREVNKVADKLASLSHTHRQQHIYTR